MLIHIIHQLSHINRPGLHACKTAASEVRNTAKDRSVKPKYHSDEAIFTEIRLFTALGCAGRFGAQSSGLSKHNKRLEPGYSHEKIRWIWRDKSMGLTVSPSEFSSSNCNTVILSFIQVALRISALHSHRLLFKYIFQLQHQSPPPPPPPAAAAQCKW